MHAPRGIEGAGTVAKVDETHAVGLRGWVESANEPSDLPIQNLPFARFRRAGKQEEFRIGVAIGDQVLDIRRADLIDHADMNALMAAPAVQRQELRHRLSRGLRAGSDEASAWRQALVPQTEVEFNVPCRIGDYTDFYSGIHHATTVGHCSGPTSP
jgi:fumarylacetoacetase